MNIEFELEIERIVLHGFEYSERYRIGKAMQEELGRLFSAEGIPTTLAEASGIELLDTLTLNIRTGKRPEETGIKLARAIYAGFVE
jgi:hypothetical protein